MTEPTSPAASDQPAYEFSEADNATVSRTARWAKALAVMFFVNMAVQVVNLEILGILVHLALGITFWRGASLLGAVVDTEGDDVPNMLGALEELQTAFTIRIIITAIAAAIGLVVSVGFFIQYDVRDEQTAREPAVTVEDAGPDDAEARAADTGQSTPAAE